MEIIIAIFLITSILLFSLSFFVPDRISILEKNLENLTLQQVQETYLLKQKIRVLEEELFLTIEGHDGSRNKQSMASGEGSAQSNQILKSQVLSLYRQGYGIEDISERSALKKTEIMSILQNSRQGDL